MKPEKILEEQRITVKRGRMNGLGFEPAFNSFFDFYLNSKYVDPPLLQLEDVTFFLFIRKNINDSNPDWKMPSLNYMKKRFRMGQTRIEHIMARLERAHLLKKISGLRQGIPNVPTDFELSDPIPTLNEFLAVLESGLFGPSPKSSEPPSPDLGEPPSPDSEQPPSPDLGELNQTSINTTSDEQTDNIFSKTWANVLGILRQHIPIETYQLFLVDTQLLAVEEGSAIISTPRPSAITWLERQMAPSIRRLLSVELGMKIEGVNVVASQKQPE